MLSIHPLGHTKKISKWFIIPVLGTLSTSLMATVDNPVLDTKIASNTQPKTNKTTSLYPLLTLKANPELFTKHLNELIVAKNTARLETILPHYKELNNQDLFVVKNADELLYRFQGKESKLDNTIKTTPSKVETTQNQEAIKLRSLTSDPELFTTYVNKLIATSNIEELKKVLPQYKKMTTNDPFLVQYSDATIYRSEGKHKKAVELYKNMLATDPTLNPVRINLAMTLLEDKQFVPAKSQLLKLKGEKLPVPVSKMVERSLSAIDRSENWKYSVSIRPSYDGNINDVPTKKIGIDSVSTVAPIKAYGIQLNSAVDKKINLSKNFFTSVGADLSGSMYFKEKEYNDYSLSASNTWGYADSKNGLSISPFATKRFYANEALNTQYGLKLNGSRWIVPKIKVSANAKYIETKHDDESNRKRDSEGYYVGLSSFYTQSAKQYFYSGLTHNRDNVDKSIILNYNRNSIYAGWGREWNRGISSSLTASYSQKDYANPTDDKSYNPAGYYRGFGGVPGSSRTDKTKSLSGQLWKRDYTIMGLTPKLAVNLSQTDSNFNYYDDRKSIDGTVILNKNF